jgi:hypothetical protein
LYALLIVPCHSRANSFQRFAFSADEDDILKFYTYRDEWSEDSLGLKEGQRLLPESRIQACITPGGLQVYFQDPSGNIRGLTQNNGAWADLGVVVKKPRNGTPLSIAYAQAQAAVYLYYVGEDESLRCVRISYPDGRTEGGQP